MVAEQLHNLESLNLCETPVTDDGLSSLVIMSNLRNLNLNSTRLSPTTYEKLRVSCGRPSLEQTTFENIFKMIVLITESQA